MIDVKAIRERVDKATPGPWVSTGDAAPWSDKRREFAFGASILRDGVPIVEGGQQYESDEAVGVLGNDDADFIAHAREDIPVLLDALVISNARAERLARYARAELELTGKMYTATRETLEAIVAEANAASDALLPCDVEGE